MNWKFWTWLAQIRKWRARAEQAEAMLAPLTAELKKANDTLALYHSRRHRWLNHHRGEDV